VKSCYQVKELTIVATTRRDFLKRSIVAGIALRVTPIASSSAVPKKQIELITAPWNLGLRPLTTGQEPGTWRAPAALLSAGLASRLNVSRLVELPRPKYEIEMQPATRIRNGVTLREHTLLLADAVHTALAASRFVVVLGGDCSVLLGCLAGARRGGCCGLVHVDGHSDFFYPGNYDAESRLGSVAGMDLALATGRGELLLTHWPHVSGPLVADKDVIQIGDRVLEGANCGPSCRGMLDAPITQFSIQEMLRLGVAEGCKRAIQHLARRSPERVWLHVDLDVLDQSVMPAVDSPGSPGLNFPQLADIISRFVATGRVAGLDLTIYDPDRDPRGEYVGSIVDCLVAGLSALPAIVPSSSKPKD
jgi:arginase